MSFGVSSSIYRLYEAEECVLFAHSSEARRCVGKILVPAVLTNRFNNASWNLIAIEGAVFEAAPFEQIQCVIRDCESDNCAVYRVNFGAQYIPTSPRLYSAIRKTHPIARESISYIQIPNKPDLAIFNGNIVCAVKGLNHISCGWKPDCYVLLGKFPCFPPNMNGAIDCGFCANGPFRHVVFFDDTCDCIDCKGGKLHFSIRIERYGMEYCHASQYIVYFWFDLCSLIILLARHCFQPVTQKLSQILSIRCRYLALSCFQLLRLRRRLSRRDRTSPNNGCECRNCTDENQRLREKVQLENFLFTMAILKEWNAKVTCKHDGSYCQRYSCTQAPTFELVTRCKNSLNRITECLFLSCSPNAGRMTDILFPIRLVQLLPRSKPCSQPICFQLFPHTIRNDDAVIAQLMVSS